jgi:hypothetical protein
MRRVLVRDIFDGNSSAICWKSNSIAHRAEEEKEEAFVSFLLL